MTEEDIQSVMAFVDAYARAKADMRNCEHQDDWVRADKEVSQCRRNLIARLKEQQ